MRNLAKMCQKISLEHNIDGAPSVDVPGYILFQCKSYDLHEWF